MRRILFAIFVLLLISACASVALVRSSLTPDDLNKARMSYDGREVMVYGFVQFEPHARGIWQDKAAFESGDASHCISLLVPDKTDLSGFHGSYVVLRGRFLRNPDVINIDACNFTHLELLGHPQLAPAPGRGALPNNSFKPNPLRGSA